MLDDVIQGSPIKHLDSNNYFFISMVKIYWIARCTTTGFYFPLFSFLFNQREEEKENGLAKPVLRSFLLNHLIFTKSILYVCRNHLLYLDNLAIIVIFLGLRYYFIFCLFSCSLQIANAFRLRVTLLKNENGYGLFEKKTSFA